MPQITASTARPRARLSPGEAACAMAAADRQDSANAIIVAFFISPAPSFREARSSSPVSYPRRPSFSPRSEVDTPVPAPFRGAGMRAPALLDAALLELLFDHL